MCGGEEASLGKRKGTMKPIMTHDILDKGEFHVPQQTPPPVRARSVGSSGLLNPTMDALRWVKSPSTSGPWTGDARDRNRELLTTTCVLCL